MNKIKTYRFLISILLLIVTQTTKGQQPVITSVTVEPLGAVKINWFPISGVSGYVIYRDSININETGFNPIDSVLGEDSYEYIDNEIDARIQSIGYKIRCIDSTPISEPHFTIYLTAVIYDSCANTNSLNWNTYSGWDGNGGAYYNIIDGNGNIIQTRVLDTFYVHSVQPDTDYSYSIRGIQNTNPTYKSTSNQASIHTSAINLPNPNEFYIKNITYNGTTANFTVTIDNTADLLGHSFRVSTDDIVYSEAGFEALDANSSVLEFSHTTAGQPLFYKVSAINLCGDTILDTDVVKPIVLTTESNETELTLFWNKSFIESIENYKIYITIDGISLAPALTNDTTTNFIFENLDPNSTGESFCFTIEAAETSKGYLSTSNTVCVSRLPKIQFPNAFTPNGDGTNDIFGPFEKYIKNVVLKEFKITIYDKFGGAIFVSDDAKLPWTGVSNRASLKYVPEGGYIYYLWFKTEQGKSYEKSGTINVVYP